MGHFFYLIGIFVWMAIFSNLLNFSKYYTIRNWVATFKKVTGKDPEQADYRDKKEFDIQLVFNSLLSFEFFWYLIGITSASWYIFVALIVLNFFLSTFTFGLPTGIIGKYLLKTFIFVKLCVVILLILNHFHFHLDWLSLLSQR
jgi:hypothetical protein